MPPSVPDAAAGEVGQRVRKRGASAVADRQHLAELVVGNRWRHGRATGRRVLDAAQAGVGIAACDRLVNGRKADRHEPWCAVHGHGR